MWFRNIFKRKTCSIESTCDPDPEDDLDVRIKQDKFEAGLKQYPIINPSNGSKFTRNCKACRIDFTSMYPESNISIEEAYERSYKTLHSRGCSETVQIIKHEINLVFAICPNCRHAQLIGYIKTGKSSMGRIVNYDYSSS